MSSIIVENCLYEYELRSKKLIVRILYRSYGFCSQSLQVWSTQGWHVGNSVVTDVQFGHLFLVCIKYVALQEVTCGLFRKISHCS